MCLEICVNNVKSDATFKIIFMFCINRHKYMYVNFYCSENSTSFAHLYGPKAFNSKGGAVCYIHVIH